MDTVLVELGLDVKDDYEAISILSKKMMEQGYVKEGYVETVMQRERSLPTALDLGSLCVAIPHTDETEYINKSKVAIAVLKQTVAFGSMLDPHETLPVKIVFLLAMKDANMQLVLLKHLMKTFRDLSMLQQIEAASDAAEVENICKSLIDNVTNEE